MTTAIVIALVLGSVVGLMGWILRNRDAAKDDAQIRAHLDALDAARTAERTERNAKFDDKAKAVGTAGDAARLLRDVSDDSNVN